LRLRLTGPIFVVAHVSDPLTLKVIETTQRRYLNRNKRTISFHAKVDLFQRSPNLLTLNTFFSFFQIESLHGSEGVLADETGNMNFVLEGKLEHSFSKI
jgi:hypothetical protein